MDLTECKKGNHQLSIIHRSSLGWNEWAVVRWCSLCGAIVVDQDFDGRTNAGRYMKMVLPMVSQEG